MEFVDTHTHLDSTAFDPDREAVIERALAAGVTRIISIGAGEGFASAERTLKLTEQYKFIWAAIGIHPNDADEPFDLPRLRDLAQHPKVVAIGETGLDFYRDYATKENQYRWFRAQVELGQELGKPVIIHSRETMEECFEVLHSMNASSCGGVFHCYPGDAAFAERLRGINFKISVGGIVTFKKAEALRDAIKQIPLEQIMLETDAPYLAPEPNRGKRCEAAMTVDTARTIAKVKEVSLEEVAAVTTRTAVEFFKLSIGD